jgi:hypothetical protein
MKSRPQTNRGRCFCAILLLVGAAGCSSQRFQTFDGILIRDKYAHTKMSFYTGNYHLQTATGLVDVADSETVPMETLEKLVGKRVQAVVRFTKGGKWDGEGQGPALEPGEEYVFPDFYTILEIKELKQ